jgi:general secretion pathway protein B
MSLILEALRRSEAERQLGRAPDVLAPMPVLRRPAQRMPRWPWWLAFALTFTAVLAWLGWRHAPRDTQPLPRIVSVPPSPIASPHATLDPATTVAQTSRSASAVGTANRTVPALPRLLPDRQPEAGVLASTARTATPATPASPTAASTTPTATTIAPPIDARPASGSGSSMPDTVPASVETLPTIADLAPAERAALPALKVSMHVWAELPGDRFMIVDGARVGEGARIGDRIVLVRIRRDGGVLDIDGRRVLLPKP